MRQGGRLAGAIEVLGAIDERHRPIAEALKDWGVAHRFAGSGDRAAIGNIVYDAMRWRLSGAWIMGADTPRALALAAVGWRQGVGAEVLAAMFADDPHAPEPLTEEETRRLAARDLSGAPPHVQADVPEWLAARFERLFGDAWVAEGEALALRPSLDMRVNRLKADRPKVLKALARFGATENAALARGLAHRGDGRRGAPPQRSERAGLPEGLV